MTETVVVIYSGGMDSFTLLHLARARGYKVHALSFDYGQRHVRELECARQVCEELSVPHKVIDIRALSEVMAGSALTDAVDVPEGHYEEDNMKATVVPNRNMILLSLATGYAVTAGAVAVWYGTAPMAAITRSIRTVDRSSWRKWTPSVRWRTMSR